MFTSLSLNPGEPQYTLTEERVEVIAMLLDLGKRRQLLAPLGGCSLRKPMYEDVKATWRRGTWV